MKKTLRILALLAFAGTLGLSSCEKDPVEPADPYGLPELVVSHDQQNRNVVLEEYTGVNCGYCPDGHATANEIMQSHPGRAFAINIHQGSYASRYKTQWGNALAAQCGISGYPTGTVNRQLFSGSSTLALSRGAWKTASNQVLAQSSCANLTARACIISAERKMVVDVKGYYTAGSKADSNLLNVVLLQNEIVGPQSNYGNYNADYITADGRYRHMHMLRDMITGQWGDKIEATTAGTEFSRRYEYDIPETISNEAVVLENLEVVVFLAESHKDIITGVAAEMMTK